MKTKEWAVFKQYVKELAFSYLNSVESKDFLRGMRFAIDKFEDDISKKMNNL
ncbi:MAG: hypothetical protein PHX18_00195 [Candidatus Gastranaerophilales bacterium]|nr:hypothetical protein [Candidatus Gastranaerophilales bacterium]